MSPLWVISNSEMLSVYNISFLQDTKALSIYHGTNIFLSNLAMCSNSIYGIFITNSVNITLKDSCFYDNNATVLDIRLVSNLKMTNLVFLSNRYSSTASCVIDKGRDLVIQDVHFLYNSNANTLGEGGGMRLVGITNAFLRLLFVGNITGGYGGGLYIGLSTNVVLEGLFVSNKSVSYMGGGAYLSCSGLVMSGYWEGNVSGNHGGGLYLSGMFNTVTNTFFVQNISSNFGGGMYTTGIYNSRIEGIFVSNEATGNNYAAGALYCGTMTNIFISLQGSYNKGKGGIVIFNGNSAYYSNVVVEFKLRANTGTGAAVSLLKASFITITNSLVSGHTNLAALSISVGTNISVIDSYFVSNSNSFVIFVGGDPVYNYWLTNFVMYNAYVIDNDASTLLKFGGKIWLIISNNIFGGISGTPVRAIEETYDIPAFGILSLVRNMFYTNTLQYLYTNYNPATNVGFLPPFVPEEWTNINNSSLLGTTEESTNNMVGVR